VNLRLEGSRSVLRPLRKADARAAFPLIHGQAEILDWLVWRGPKSVRELEDFYAHWSLIGAEGGNYHLAVLDRSTLAFCGSLSLRFAEHAGIGDLGYWIGRDSWGRGIGTDAIFLAAHLAFRHLAADLLRAVVFVGNDRSRRALERVGFQTPGSTEAFTCPDGREVLQQRFELEREPFLEQHSERRPELDSVSLE
jgi:RimJ/RimL family protein N-acetyltransferase